MRCRPTEESGEVGYGGVVNLYINLRFISQFAVVPLLLWSGYAQGPQSHTVQPKFGTEFVQCVRDDKGVDIASREMRTPVIVSKDGPKSFGVVLAELQGSSCRNRTTVYLAEPGRPFRLVFQQEVERDPDPAGTIYDGNGIEALRWSPSGKYLLAEITQWTWGSDFGFNTKYLVIAHDSSSVKQIFPEKTIRALFKSPCSMTIKSIGWSGEAGIRMEASPFIDEENGTPSCINSPTSFLFNIVTEKATRLN
jgi:hypothetical protein